MRDELLRLADGAGELVADPRRGVPLTSRGQHRLEPVDLAGVGRRRVEVHLVEAGVRTFATVRTIASADETVIAAVITRCTSGPE